MSLKSLFLVFILVRTASAFKTTKGNHLLVVFSVGLCFQNKLQVSEVGEHTTSDLNCAYMRIESLKFVDEAMRLIIGCIGASPSSPSPLPLTPGVISLTLQYAWTYPSPVVQQPASQHQHHWLQCCHWFQNCNCDDRRHQNEHCRGAVGSLYNVTADLLHPLPQPQVQYK